MSVLAVCFGAFVAAAEAACAVVGGVKSRLNRSFWAEGGGEVAAGRSGLAGFEVAGGGNILADRSTRCACRVEVAVFVGGALSTGGAGVAGISPGADAGAGAGASPCQSDRE